MEGRKNDRLLTFVEGAVIAGVCVALSYVPAQFGPGAAFDISLGLIPLFIYSVRRGLGPALVCGFLWGLLVAISKGYFFEPLQWVFDYLLAFGFAGFFGLFSGRIRGALASGSSRRVVCWVAIASVVGVFARWFWHFWAGVFVWGEYAPEGVSPLVYSITYNGASFVANVVVLIVVMSILVNKAPRLFRV
jgi:thiamine transporter